MRRNYFIRLRDELQSEAMRMTTHLLAVLRSVWPRWYYNYMRSRAYRAFQNDLKNAKDDQERLDAEASAQFKISEYEDELLRIDGIDIIERGKRVHIRLEDVPKDDATTNVWRLGQNGAVFLNAALYHRMAKMVEEAEYLQQKRKHEAVEIWLKWITVVAAIVAACASFYNALRK